MHSGSRVFKKWGNFQVVCSKLESRYFHNKARNWAETFILWSEVNHLLCWNSVNAIRNNSPTHRAAAQNSVIYPSLHLSARIHQTILKIENSFDPKKKFSYFPTSEKTLTFCQSKSSSRLSFTAIWANLVPNTQIGLKISTWEKLFSHTTLAEID